MITGRTTVVWGFDWILRFMTNIFKGLIPPTTGRIIVNGFDVATSMNKIRNNLGLCPQYNILFDQLTVREHLKLFATVSDIVRQQTTSID
jgi:ATP-binding cassette, subfamily A (ABC1), member 3